MKICIDPGHGGTDSGAVGEIPHRLEEKAVNLAVSLVLEQELTSLGHRVVMTRRVDRTLSLGARSDFANRLDVDFFVSVHTNSAANSSAEGMEVFHYEGSSAGAAKAASVLKAMLDPLPKVFSQIEWVIRNVELARFARGIFWTGPKWPVPALLLSHGARSVPSKRLATSYF